MYGYEEPKTAAYLRRHSEAHWERKMHPRPEEEEQTQTSVRTAHCSLLLCLPYLVGFIENCWKAL